MNRRDILAAVGISVSALLPAIEPDADLTPEEITALERITAKVEAGQVEEMYSVRIVGGDKNTVTVSLEWTDPDILLLRDHGLMG